MLVEPSVPSLEVYLNSVGRSKLIVPLYQALMTTPAGTVFAKRVFAEARAGYHPQTLAAVEAIVDPKGESSE